MTDAPKIGDTVFMEGYRKDRRFKSGVRHTGKPDDKVRYIITHIVTGPPGEHLFAAARARSEDREG